MKTSEFLQAYPRELSPNKIHQGATIPIVRATQQYSYGYGLVAHAALRGEYEAIGPLLPPLIDYENTTTIGEIEQTLLQEPTGWDYRNEVNFFGLNEPMRDLWTPLIHGEWPKGLDRTRAVHVAMNALALEGLTLFAARDLAVRSHGTESFYEPENAEFFSRLTGAMQEVDVAIVALAAILREPNLTLVPAPMQFERNRAGANADFLVVDLQEDRTAGIQVKTQVRDEAFKQHDRKRIALIDGTIDLGNVRVVRTKKGRSTEQPKPWPGIVAASRVHNIQLHGKHQQIPQQYAQEYMRKKMKARELVGNLRVDYKELASKIGGRIMSRLYDT